MSNLDESVKKDMADSISRMVDGKVAGVRYYHSPQGFEVFDLNIEILNKIGQLESIKKMLQEFGGRYLTEDKVTVTWIISGWWKNPYK